MGRVLRGEKLLAAVGSGHRPTAEEALALADSHDLPALIAVAAALAEEGHRNVVSYSRKVFLPLTHLCRDICHYCVFAQPPRPGQTAFMSREEVLDQARAGAELGCKEALFTLGDQPESRYRAAREALSQLGHPTTLSYLREVAQLVLDETGLLPHLNPGLMDRRELEELRPVAPSMGLMLESASPRLLEKGQAHYGCPDKVPARRLETIRLAGEAAIPFTSGILIGIGERRRERIEALLALRELHDRYGHLQEIIVQNFRAKKDTRMAEAAEPSLEDLLWTVAVARLVFGAEMSIQAPPNLSSGALPRLVGAGINDWGGVSPLTPDFVNPEAPWPHLETLGRETAAAGKVLTERLTVYPSFAREPERWLDPSLQTRVRRAIDGEGFARTEAWLPGALIDPPESPDAGWAGDSRLTPGARGLDRILERATSGVDLSEGEVVRLFESRGDELTAVLTAADELRAQVNGETVTYVVNRNINYTNLCYFRCQFCAFSKGKLSENLRGRPYDLTLDEIVRRSQEAWQRGATEVCLQGGIHPDYTGETYLDICRAIKAAEPGLHIHAFSPLEVWQGAATLGVSLAEFLERLAEAGLGTLPGTAAEVLDDEVRAVLCPDKIRTEQWLEVMETAHRQGLRSTATIMFGHVDGPSNWARHLLRLRALQERTGGFTEFVPLPFVSMEAPIYLKGRSRQGPTFREAILMHAVSRLALHPYLTNIQASWVKLGPKGVGVCLRAGVNDLGGTLMNESITRAAGAAHGQELSPEGMAELIGSAGRRSRQRTTTYGPAPEDRVVASLRAAPLRPPVFTPAGTVGRSGSASLPLVRPV